MLRKKFNNHFCAKIFQKKVKNKGEQSRIRMYPNCHAAALQKQNNIGYIAG